MVKVDDFVSAPRSTSLVHLPDSDNVLLLPFDLLMDLTVLVMFSWNAQARVSFEVLLRLRGP